MAVNDRIQYSLVEVLPAPDAPPSSTAPPSPPSPSDDAASSNKKNSKGSSSKEGDEATAAAADAKGPTFGRGARNTGTLLAALQGAEAAGGSEGEGGGAAVRRHLVVASDLVESLATKWRCSLSTVATFPGSSLQGCWYAWEPHRGARGDGEGQSLGSTDLAHCGSCRPIWRHGHPLIS